MPPLDGFMYLCKLLSFGLAGKIFFNKGKQFFKIKYEIVAAKIISKKLLKKVGIKFNYFVNYYYLQYNISNIDLAITKTRYF